MKPDALLLPAALLALAGVVGCGSSDEPEDPGDFAPVPVTGSRCNAVIQRHAIDGGHVAECSPLTFSTNPPSSGTHYDFWADYGEYAFALPRGYWVHNLEHGAIVISHHCETGCDAELGAARQRMATLWVDDFCIREGLSRPRLVMTPDPLLDTTWAASAWGYTLRAGCFEPEVFGDFYAAHVGQGPENVCSTGVDFRDGSVPPDCG